MSGYIATENSVALLLKFSYCNQIFGDHWTKLVIAFSDI